jgi:hypothetical protein
LTPATREGDEGGEEPTNRRQLLGGGLATAALAVLPGPNQVAVRPDEDDTHLALTLIPRAYRRIEAQTRSDHLVRPVSAHLRLLRHLASTTPGPGHVGRVRLLAALSETAGLAAWLYTDLDERAAARRHYQIAVAAAERTEQPLLAAYMQGSYGQFATSAGDARQGLSLIAAARKRAASWPPIADVWFDVLSAGALAGTGDLTALALVDRAEARLARVAAQEPVWPWVYAFDEIKLAGYRAEIATRLDRWDIAEQAYRVADRVSRAPKQAALAGAQRATALAATGDVERACSLAATALDTATRLGSHRGVHAVARFRALLPEHATHAAALDRRLDRVRGRLVTRIAVSGHRELTPDVTALVDRAIRSELAAEDPETLVGISCLADGADQIFARAVLDAGGRLEVIVPARAYRDGLPTEFHAEYDLLLSKASTVTALDREDSTSDAHMDASITMLARADRLLAVWDGQPSRAPGGTADVVDHARAHDIPICVIWPEGASR